MIYKLMKIKGIMKKPGYLGNCNGRDNQCSAISINTQQYKHLEGEQVLA